MTMTTQSTQHRYHERCGNTRSRNPVTRGFVALISVLLVGAVALVIAIGASLRSFHDGRVSFTGESSLVARALADSCVAHALAQLSSAPSYAGNEDIVIGEERCRLGNIEEVASQEYTIPAESTVSRYTKRVLVHARFSSSSPTVLRWEDATPP